MTLQASVCGLEGLLTHKLSYPQLLVRLHPGRNPCLVQHHHISSLLPALGVRTMVEATLSFSMPQANIPTHLPHSAKLEMCSFPNTLRMIGGSKWNSTGLSQNQGKSCRRGTHSWRANALPDWFSVPYLPLMAVFVEHAVGQRDYVVHKSVWHLNDETIKNIYTMYIMFTCWGCCFFGSAKDPFYDGEKYRKDGGDGTVHWIYEKQEDIEENSRAELLREELLEEIELKVGGLRELEEASKEELVK